MGSMECSTLVLQVNRNQFCFKCIIGRGGFGKVWKVVYKQTNAYYALKEMSKLKVIDKKSEKIILSERHILSNLHHPYNNPLNCLYCLIDYSYVYLVMDLLLGGDLRFHIAKRKKFTEEQTKFFMCCIILGLEYIHNKGIAHRDIKPENLVFDDKGYIRITDFGIAKRINKDNEYDTSGTPGYMAPEVIYSENQSHLVDYFALGVIGYECMLGSRPYIGRNRRDIKLNMLAQQIQIKPNEVPIGWSFEAADLINQLIQRKQSSRLGCNGIAEIKNHNWLKDVNWNDIAEKKLISPFIPLIGDNYDIKYCNVEDKIGSETQERYKLYQDNEKYQSLFNNYTFNNIPQEELKQLLSPMNSISTRSSPNEHRSQLIIKDSPSSSRILKTPNASELKRLKQKTIYLSNCNNGNSKSNTKSTNRSKVDITVKDTLPLISPPTSLHKSGSSMIFYKTNNQLSQLSKKKRKYKMIRQNFFKANSPIMLVKRMSHILPKDIPLIKNNSSTIILKVAERDN